jgi:hypothetical protein
MSTDQKESMSEDNQEDVIEAEEETLSRPYVAIRPEQYLGKSSGNGHCVAFVREAAHAPHTSDWNEGAAVQGNTSIRRGTAIATFQDGEYKNRTNGDSHAAIYLEQNENGMWVFDQWISSRSGRKPVRKRFIRFKEGADEPRNDGSAYAVIER